MANDWPALDYEASKDTLFTLQLWSQVVGKVRLALTPWLNHSWHVPLYVNARGVGTSAIPIGAELFEIDFDFVAHQLEIRMSTGERAGFPLAGLCVADFHDRLLGMLRDLGISVEINPTPQEITDPIRLDEDRKHAGYDGAQAHAYWRALIQVDRVFKRFRTGFLGKASPVHLFWGAFDLATTRFSGRPAPAHPGMPGLVRVMREAYSHEVSSAGFWPGSDAYPRAAFYSYAYPEPAAFAAAAVPEGAVYSAALGEFVMPYDTVRTARDPEACLLGFLEATYVAASRLGDWDVARLETGYGRPAVPRAI
jgi:hypothetical protein